MYTLQTVCCIAPTPHIVNRERTSSLRAVALAIHDLALEQRHCGVCRGGGGAIELRRALAVVRTDHRRERRSLVVEVALHRRAHGDVARLLGVVWVRVQRVAPGLVLRVVGVPAVVVVAEPVVGSGLDVDLVGLLLHPVLARAARLRRGLETLVALALVRLLVAAEVEVRDRLCHALKPQRGRWRTEQERKEGDTHHLWLSRCKSRMGRARPGDGP